MASRAKVAAMAAMLALWPMAAPLALPDAARQAELLHRLRHDCGSCHGLTMKGGLGPALLPDRLAAMPDALLIQIILEGLQGTPMPPWGVELSADEAAWMVRWLKQGLPQ